MRSSPIKPTSAFGLSTLPTRCRIFYRRTGKNSIQGETSGIYITFPACRAAGSVEKKKELKRLETEKMAIAEQIETRIQELVKTDSEIVRTSIEQSIEKLEAGRLEIDEKVTYIKRYLLELESVRKNGTDLHKGLKTQIRDVLELVENQPVNMDKQIRERSKAEMRHLSSREIGREIDISHQAVLSAIEKYGLNGTNGATALRPGQIPFGWDYVDCQLKKNCEEQEVIGIIKLILLEEAIYTILFIWQT
jgi:hypothetical protein